MSVLAVVQARMGSSRLPGKVLADVGGQPMLAFMLGRLRSASVDDIVVATSTEEADGQIEDVARAMGVACVRGSEQDVLERFSLAVRSHPCDTVVRLTGDCPLIDPAIVDAALERHAATQAAYTSNTIIRTFPDGLDVEVLRRDALLTAAAEATARDEREHVTPFVYRHPGRFRLAALRTPLLAGDERWTVDTPEDLALVRSIVTLVRDRHLPWDKILDEVGRQSVPRPGELHLRPALPGDSDLLLSWRNDEAAVRMSRSGTTVPPEDHVRWFRDAVDDPARRIWIGVVDGVAVGQVRVDARDGGEGLVSITVGPEHRGRGFGRSLLMAMHRAILADLQIIDLLAEIHPANEASIAAFTAAGYVPAGELEGFMQMRRRR